MAFDADTRTQLLLSLLSWALLLVIFFATKRIRDKAPAQAPAAAETGRRANGCWCWPTRRSRATS